MVTITWNEYLMICSCFGVSMYVKSNKNIFGPCNVQPMKQWCKNIIPKEEETSKKDRLDIWEKSSKNLNTHSHFFFPQPSPKIPLMPLRCLEIEPTLKQLATPLGRHESIALIGCREEEDIKNTQKDQPLYLLSTTQIKSLNPQFH